MSAPTSSHLVFSRGASWYAVPAEQVSEVVSLPGLTRVPGAPGFLAGIFPHRGEVVPVVDMAPLTGKKAEPMRRAVLVRAPTGSLALSADKVAGVSSLTGAFEPLGKSGVHLHLRGPVKSHGDEVAAIDLDGFVDFLKQGG